MRDAGARPFPRAWLKHRARMRLSPTATTKEIPGKRCSSSCPPSSRQSQKVRPAFAGSSSRNATRSKRPVLRAVSRTTFPWPPAPQISKRLFMLLGNACRAREFWHRRMPLLADAVRPQHLEQGQQENLDVEPKAPVVHIPDVKIEFLFPGDRVPAVDLRPAGNAWLNLVTPTLVRAVARQVLGQQSEEHTSELQSLRHLVCRLLLEK